MFACLTLNNRCRFLLGSEDPNSASEIRLSDRETICLINAFDDVSGAWLMALGMWRL